MARIQQKTINRAPKEIEFTTLTFGVHLIVRLHLVTFPVQYITITLMCHFITL